ncbi:DUF1611 domain-containing protein [Oscillatoria sp. FACHB-1406]|uniref:DUF1611 domain-containing protein n=1 Tax=Oscillatoria sp. FACHB-1406 TaxID=2692846 RepID=UPI001687BBA8|nr:DUF1611 domain-containing protein [Oscillatoria sp. FACHB-1406]
MQLTRDNRVAILLHQGVRNRGGKTGLAYLRYGEAPVVAVIDADCPGESLRELTGIPCDAPIVDSVTEALAYHPDVLLIGLAPTGGKLPPAWQQEVKEAVEAGLSLVNGLHASMQGIVENLRPGQWIWDIRQEPPGLSVAKGKARSLPCQRILAVGTDMRVGKMSACLELQRAAHKQGLNSRFIATGQAGLMIAGEGIPLDAVRVDFAAGAVEAAVLEAGKDCDILFIEGQGSLLHPGSTAALPLMRGSQPTGLILVHKAGQESIHNCPDIFIPPLPEVVQLYETVVRAGGAFFPAKVKAIALNTSNLDEYRAQQEIDRVSEETGLPCYDVVRFGAEDLLKDALCEADAV